MPDSTSRRNTKASSTEEKKVIRSFLVVVGTHIIQNVGQLCRGNIARRSRNSFEYLVVGMSRVQLGAILMTW
jgi:hypothetical protein